MIVIEFQATERVPSSHIHLISQISSPSSKNRGIWIRYSVPKGRRNDWNCYSLTHKYKHFCWQTEFEKYWNLNISSKYECELTESVHEFIFSFISFFGPSGARATNLEVAVASIQTPKQIEYSFRSRRKKNERKHQNRSK